MSVPIVAPPVLDRDALMAWRVGRVRRQMVDAGVDLLVLVNPASLRYAVDWREYAVFQSRIPTFYLFIDQDGHTILHGGYGAGTAWIDEIRPADYMSVFDAGLDLGRTADRFAAEIVRIVGEGATVALERLSPSAVQVLEGRGVRVVDADPIMEAAHKIKSPEELVCMRHSIAVAEAAMDAMAASLQPGVTENELFAILHQTNIANGGDWIDGRMLSSGPRTNPWYQEASDRRIEAGELVAFDTDMIGPNGYCADISRTWLVGDGPPTALQRDRFGRAREEIEHNIELLAPGMTYKEFSDRAFRQPDEFVANRYACVAHGVGMTDEYPKIYYRQDWNRHGYDGVIEPDMVLCIESYVGSEHGGPGVKLEQMVHVGERTVTVLSHYPFDDALS